MPPVVAVELATHLERYVRPSADAPVFDERLHPSRDHLAALRPKSTYIRFQADLPNETWQADFTHHRLTDGTDTEILCWIDDHSRFVGARRWPQTTPTSTSNSAS